MAANIVYWDYGVKPKDACHIATAAFHKIPTLHTFDGDTTSIRSQNLRLTNWAIAFRVLALVARLIEYGLLSALIAVCTYPMRGFAVCHRFLKTIDDSSGVWGVKFVALLLCFPCFHACNFCFKSAYFLGHRKLLCIGRQRFTLS